MRDVPVVVFSVPNSSCWAGLGWAGQWICRYLDDGHLEPTSRLGIGDHESHANERLDLLILGLGLIDLRLSAEQQNKPHMNEHMMKRLYFVLVSSNHSLLLHANQANAM